MVSERQVIAGGKYELQKLLGQGSMGEVWLARHTSLEGAYAVKVTDVRAVPDAAGRFQMEAHIAARLSKKTRHIVSVTDHGEEGDLAYLVMELLEGESLESRMASGAPLSMAELAFVVTQVSRALAHAQTEGFIHRDLKPANVFLTKDEDGHLVAKVLDFGIARAMHKVRTRSPFATAKDMLVGTPSYMSPEQALGLDTIDHRCDVWALAVLTYEALTQRLPFEGESIQDVLIGIGIGRRTPIRDHRPDLPESIDAFYDRAFAEKIDDRFATAAELAAAFACIAGVDNTSRPSFGHLPPMVVSAIQAPRDTRADVPAPAPLPVAGAPEPAPAPDAVPMRSMRRGVWIALAVVALASSAAAIGLGRSSAGPSPASRAAVSDRSGAAGTPASAVASEATTAEAPLAPETTPESVPAPEGSAQASAAASSSAPSASASSSASSGGRRERAPAVAPTKATATSAGMPGASSSSRSPPPRASAKPVDRAEVF